MSGSVKVQATRSSTCPYCMFIGYYSCHLIATLQLHSILKMLSDWYMIMKGTRSAVARSH